MVPTTLTATGTALPTGRSWEDTACTAIMLTLGTIAAAGSYTHIRATAAHHGQAGWISYAIAATVDLLALGSGLEIRRRHRHHAAARWPWCTLLMGVAMTLGANLATADPSAWGAVMAVWPALAFLAAVLLIETRVRPAATPAVTEPVTEPVTVAVTDTAADTRPDNPTPPDKPKRRTDTRAAVAALRARHPDMTQAAIAAELRVSRSAVASHWKTTTPDPPHLAAVREA